MIWFHEITKQNKTFSGPPPPDLKIKWGDKIVCVYVCVLNRYLNFVVKACYFYAYIV